MPTLPRLAHDDDFAAIQRIDPLTRNDPERIRLLQRCRRDGTLLVVSDDEDLVGFAALDHTFFGRAFVHLLFVQEHARRRGHGSRLLTALESEAKASEVFTSTNRSNAVARALLGRHDYREAGIIHDLDPGDPEIVYHKALLPAPPSEVGSR